MRCDCCNKLLNDFEATRRSAVSGDYLNTCNKCLKGLGIPTIDRADLNPTEFVEDYWDDLASDDGYTYEEPEDEDEGK